MARTGIRKAPEMGQRAMAVMHSREVHSEKTLKMGQRAAAESRGRVVCGAETLEMG